ncbi:hypothetical protein N790_00535 [Arenimonas malthae CC-JY-1]|uniref:Uncharacterized protein n=1 Tax=Arenimonas malthae CC-JY-1 TaxID=1384054 RepID=A0A091BN93_9GAMM|nr:hypothetical protein [Arenimonas malthae]KFN52289.1 hypothetical protein N790_00535 [Arenimonas malthae CC-JY-1]
MSTKSQRLQRLIQHYRDETGNASVDMHEVAKFAADRGYPLPKPKSALDRLAEQLSIAAREEVRHDKVTGRPYRANLAVVQWNNGQQLTLWHDIDVAPRRVAHKAFVQRREQMVGDALQLTLDVTHWNRVHEGEDPIVMPLDFTDDVEWRLNAPDQDDKAA